MRYIFNIVIVMVAMFLISPLSYAGENEYSLLDHCPNQRKDHVFVQSVDTKANGSLTGRESSAARDIAERGNQPVVCVSKTACN